MNEAADRNSVVRHGETRHGIVVLAAAVMPIMAIISLVPVLPLLMREFASVPGSEFLVPMALTVPALCVALFSPLAGWLSDRFGRKKLLVAALILYAAFGVIPWFLTSLFQIIGARVALGIVEAIIMTVATALIGDYYEGERRERWIALQIAVGSLAAIALIAIGGGLGEAFGSRGPFLLYLLALPIALAVALVLFEPNIRSNRSQGPKVGFPYVAMLPLVAITLGVGMIFYTVIVQLGAILELSGPVSPGVIGVVGAIANLGVSAGSFIFNQLKKKTGPILLALGLGLAAFGYFGAGISSELAMIGAFVVLACIGSGILLPNMLTWTMGRLPAEMRGSGMGLWTGSFFLGQFLAPLAAAATITATDGLANALLVYAVCIGIAAVVATVSARRQPTRTAA